MLLFSRVDYFGSMAPDEKALGGCSIDGMALTSIKWTIRAVFHETALIFIKIEKHNCYETFSSAKIMKSGFDSVKPPVCVKPPRIVCMLI